MRRQTIILLVLFVLLAGLTWVMQQPNNFIKQALTASATPLAKERLVSPNNGMISRLEIKDASGETMLLDNSSGFWTVNAGKNGPADQNQAETAISKLYSLMIVAKLEKAPNPAGTGLDKPAFAVNVTQETSSTSFSVGKLSATGSGFYVQMTDGSVAIINKDGIEALMQNLTNPPLVKTPSVSPASTP